ncbi:MAG: hypothetical protein COB66_08445 [Coxiella sp. (in: Bacteria)]|nr:MAG: hypothetical protein COB66_08445 [Coxiella sp. (in: g-proteobacteria)]
MATVLNKSAQVDAQQAVIVDGVCQFSPIQRWFIDQNFSNPNYFNQSYFFKLLNEVKYEDLNEAFGAIQEMHDEFWLRLDRDGGQFYLKQADRCCIQVERYSCPKQTLDQQIKWVEVKVNTAQAELNLGSGPLTKMLLFGDCVDGKQRVAWIIHHWMVDTVSWNILIDDISMLLQGKQLAPKSASYADWTKTINYQKMLLTEDDNNYWKALLDKTEPFLKTKLTNRQKADYRQISVSLDSILSEKMLKISVNKTAIALDRLVMNAVFTTLADILKKNEFLIDVESHGRDLTDELNIIRTVGWFTNMYPIKFKKTNNCIDTLKGIESSISRTPKLGSGYGMWRYLCAIEGLVNNIEVGFNFLGDQSSSRHDILETSGEIDLHEIDNANYPWHMLDVNSWVQDGVIRIRISFHPELLTDVESNSLIPSITDNLNDLAESLNKKNLCNELSTEVVGKNKLQSQKQGYSLPATTTQHLMYCCSTKIDKSEYTTQIILDCSDNDIDIFETWENIFKQHPVLASSFIMNSDHQLLQIIGQFKNFERYAYDWSGFSDDDIKQKIEGFLDCDMQKGFDFITPSPLMRIAVLKLAGGNNKCIWTHHHILIDGWSMAKILESWYSLLSGSGNIESKEAELERYAQWRYNQEQNDDVIYWNNRLKKIRSRNLVRKQLPSKTSFHSFKKNIGRELTEKISNLCSQSSITPNILFQCSWELICSAYTGNHTVIHDVITSGRTANFSGVEDVIGLTMNILPYVTKLDVSKDVVEFLKSSQEQFYQDMAHDNITWNKIFDADLQKRMSISDSLFVYENYQADKIGGVNKIDCRSKTHYPIVIAILPGESTTVAFDYKSEYFSKKQVELFANIMVKTLNSVVCHGEHKEVGDLLEDIVMLASESNTATRTLLVNFSIRQEKRDKNIFLIHPGSSGAEAYSDFHKKLLMDFNVLAIDSYNKSTSYWPLITIKQMAKKYIQVMKSEQKHGPYTILGWSLGGVIAYEMAQQLRLEGESVAQLGLIDSFNFSKNAKMVADYLYKLINLRTQQSEWFKSLSSIEQENLDRLSYVESQAIANYKVKPYNNEVVLYKAQQGRSDVLELGDDQLQCFSDNMLIVKDNGWSGVIDNLEVVNVPAHHYNILQNKTGKEIAEDMTEKARRY